MAKFSVPGTLSVCARFICIPCIIGYVVSKVRPIIPRQIKKHIRKGKIRKVISSYTKRKHFCVRFGSLGAMSAPGLTNLQRKIALHEEIFTEASKWGKRRRVDN